MTLINQLMHNIIDKILSIKNEELLSAFDKILDSNNNNDVSISLTKEQIEMLKMSDLDIEKGNLISQEEIDKMDVEWLS